MKTIDLRSDTVTKPTAAMRRAMMEAEVGDDVYGEDPSVNQLQALAAERLGFEAALYVSSGTQSNLLGIMSHCQRGDEYIVGQMAHTYRFEGGGAAVLGSIQPQPLDFDADGSIDLERAAQAIKPDDFHFARTRLFCLENTQGGKVLPLAYLQEAAAFCKEHHLAFHLDGARVFNAAVSLGVPVSGIAQYFDSVSVCLSKGMGAPVGSVLCGSAELINKARRWRKVVGGGMRQAGMLAAAGIYALNHHVDRLAEDHANAKMLAQGLAQVHALDFDPGGVQTNMLFVPLGRDKAQRLAAFLRRHDVLIRPADTVRMVTHLDISSADIERVVELVREFFRDTH